MFREIHKLKQERGGSVRRSFEAEGIEVREWVAADTSR
jgi:hypothetical protein